MDTHNILFVGAGAFEGIMDCSLDGLKKYGMIPELLGRFPVLTEMTALTKQELLEVLAGTHNCLIKQYSQLFKQSGAALFITEGAAHCIVDLAYSRGVGARGLRAIMEDLLLDAMFDLPSPDVYHFDAPDVKRILG